MVLQNWVIVVSCDVFQSHDRGYNTTCTMPRKEQLYISIIMVRSMYLRRPHIVDHLVQNAILKRVGLFIIDNFKIMMMYENNNVLKYPMVPLQDASIWSRIVVTGIWLVTGICKSMHLLLRRSHCGVNRMTQATPVASHYAKPTGQR